MQTLIKPIAVIFISIIICSVTSCQKTINGSVAGSNTTSATSELWVLKSRTVHYFQQSPSSMFPDNTNYVTYSYNALSKTISVLNVFTPNGIPDSSTASYHYDNKGRLIEYNGGEAKITYNTDDLPEMINYYYSGSNSNNWKFTWSSVDGESSALMKDPSDRSTPYSSGNRNFRITKQKQLIEELYIATDTTRNSEKTLAYRNTDGDVTTMTIGYGKRSSYNVRDSVVFTRDKGYPSRLFDFYHFWSGGLDWLPIGIYEAVGFTDALSADNELFQFERNMTNKITYYTRDIDVNPNSVNYRIEYTDVFQTQYDSNKNPVKITVTEDGNKLMEMTFVWERIKW